MNVSLPLLMLASLGAVVVLMAITALVSRRVGRVSVVDVTWGLGFVVVAAVSAALGDEPVRWVLLAMVGVWGLRLGWHIGKRQLGHPEEDPRYAKYPPVPVLRCPGFEPVSRSPSPSPTPSSPSGSSS